VSRCEEISQNTLHLDTPRVVEICLVDNFVSSRMWIAAKSADTNWADSTSVDTNSYNLK